MSKKLLSLALALAMCLTLCVPAFAKERNFDTGNSAVKMIENSIGDEFLKDSIIQKVDQDLDQLEKLGFAGNLISIHEIDEDNQVSYSYAVSESLNSVICVKESENNATILDVTEGDCHNVLEVRKDGTLILDGQKVNITFEENVSNSTISPNSIRQRVFQETPFDSAPSSGFTKYIDDVLVPDVDVGEKITNVTNTVLTTIMSTAIGLALGGVGGSIIGAAIGAGLSIAASDMKTLAEQYAPNTAHFSFKQYRYEHNTMSKPIDRYYKYNIKFYAERNYVSLINPPVCVYERDYIA